MGWNSVKSVLGKLAPTVGMALGGPLGGAAAGVIASALGLTPEDSADPVKISSAIAQANPEQLLALKTADQAFQAKMAELGFKNIADLSALENSDRDSARKREQSIKDLTPSILALAVTAGFFGLLAFMCLYEVPEKSSTLLNVMIGSLGTAWISIVSYYFGSSSSSSRKTELLAKSTPPNPSIDLF